MQTGATQGQQHPGEGDERRQVPQEPRHDPLVDDHGDQPQSRALQQAFEGGLSQQDDAGLQPIKGAQLYPALVKMENDGLIAARWEQSESGPARKVYELTDAGRTEVARLREEWRAFTAAAAALGAVPAR